MSYASNDSKKLQIEEFMEKLKGNPELDKLISCTKIKDDELRQICIQDALSTIDYCVFFCTEEGLSSRKMSEEVEIAYMTGKEIIPIYDHYCNIFPFIRHKQGIQVDDSRLDLWNSLAAAHIELDEFNEAEQVFKHIIENWPDVHQTYSNLGVLYVRSGMSHKSKKWVVLENYQTQKFQ